MPFRVRFGDVAVAYQAMVEDGALVHRALDREAHVLRERSEPQALSEYLDPRGEALSGLSRRWPSKAPVLYELQREQVPIDMDKLVALSWEGVDIQRESQGSAARPGDCSGTSSGTADIARGLGCGDRRRRHRRGRGPPGARGRR